MQLREVVDAPAPFPADRFAGRGIVICAGGARLFTCAWVAINVLRTVLGCELPIELWHLGPGEIGSVEAALVGELGVETVDALALSGVAPPRVRGGWELKSFAIVHSRFAQVISLDADNVPVRDPAVLLDSDEFAATGAIAWPDILRLRTDNPIWSLSGLEPRDDPSWDSGQLVVDKARCWHALQIALHMNMHSDVFYRDLHGDKDTFYLAFVLAGTPWSMPGYPARWTYPRLCQRDFAGELIFQHRTNAKWRLDGPNERSEDFVHEAACLRFVEDLRSRWSGRISAIADRTPADLAAERELVAQPWFEMTDADARTVVIELLPDNMVGVGRSRRDRLQWFVSAGALIFEGRKRLLPSLWPQPDGRWTGAADAGQITLEPVPQLGEDAIGLAAQAIIGELADGCEHGPGFEEADAVTALLVLSRTGCIDGALLRAQARWGHSPSAVRVIAAVQRRIGIRDASVDFHDLHDRYDPVE